MKKNKGLVIALIIVVLIIAAVAVWYFFFRTPPARIGDGAIDMSATGATGTNVLGLEGRGQETTEANTSVNTSTLFSDAIANAKLKINNNALLTDIEKFQVITIIEKDISISNILYLATSTQTDIVEIILIETQKIYLEKYGRSVPITTASQQGSDFLSFRG